MQTVAIGPEGTGIVKLNGSGAGQVRVGPQSARERWTPVTAAVKVATNASEASCRIYNGDQPIDANFTDGTINGSTGDSTDRVGGAISVGQYLWAVWAGGDPGAIATLNVTGTKTI